MILLVMIVSLELFVMDETEPPYAIAFAWFVLLLIWTSMRFDDSRGLLPSKLKLLDKGLEGTIVRSKASGQDKKV